MILSRIFPPVFLGIRNFFCIFIKTSFGLVRLGYDVLRLVCYDGPMHSKKKNTFLVDQKKNKILTILEE